ncbi:MAG: (Fe-S)-binding protein [Candidatus Hodarchaeota archaeon]
MITLIQSREEAKKKLLKCVRCGRCRALCPVFAVTGFETYGARGKNIVIEQALEGNLSLNDPDLKKLVFACAQCKGCEELCPSGMKTAELVAFLRKEMHKEQIEPLEEHKTIIDNILTHESIFPQRPNYPSSLPNLKNFSVSAETAFFSGCTTLQDPSKAVNRLVLMDVCYGKPFQVLKESEPCCGGILEMYGCEGEFIQIAQRNIARFEKQGIKHLIVSCPFCFITIKDTYPKIGVKHSLQVSLLLEFIADYLERHKDQLKEYEAKVTYHDGCHLGRYPNPIYQELPRQIIKAIPGTELVELPKTGRETRCCGGPIRIPFLELRSNMSDIICESAEDLEAEKIITSCPSCAFNIDGELYDMETLDLYDLLIEVLEDVKNHS